MTVYKKIVVGISKVFEALAALSVLAMFTIVFYNIIMRYFFANSPRWAEELARQCVVVFAFIGMALGVRERIHIAFSFVVDTLLKRISLPIEIIIKLLTLTIGILMSVFMGPYFIMLRYNRLVGSGIPVGYIYLFPTAMGILIALIAVYQIYEHFKYGTDAQQKEMIEKAQKEAY